MECNKDEAVRARQIAEARMQRGEFVEALKFANKAKKLYPDVESITQILTICDVHNAAQKKLAGSGDMDWYAILQIERLAADEAAIRKQYRRLALMLHPDKNKFAGAEAAFKLVGQANGVLSDQAKRSLYDTKFGASVVGGASHHNSSNGNVFAAKHNPNAMNSQKSSDFCHFSSNGNVFAAKWDANATNCQKKAGRMTFWTSCQHCDRRYQYRITFVNASLLCQQCKMPFKAHAISFGYQGVSPPNIPKEAPPMHCPSKPASESAGGKNPLGREHAAGTFVQFNTTSMKKCAAGVGSHFGGEKSKDGNVPASQSPSRATKNVGSTNVRQPAPDATNYPKNCSDSHSDSNGNVFAAKHDADEDAANYQKNNSDSHQYSDGNVFTAKHDANATTNYKKNSYPNATSSSNQAKRKTFWTSCQHCHAKYEYCIPFVNATLSCKACLKSFKARPIPEVNIINESPMHDPSTKQASSESTGGVQHACKQSNPIMSMKRCAPGVGEGAKSKDGYVHASSRGMNSSQTSKNVGGKRVRRSAAAPDSGEILKARIGEEMNNDANVRGNHVDPSRVNAMRSARKKQHVSS